MPKNLLRSNRFIFYSTHKGRYCKYVLFFFQQANVVCKQLGFIKAAQFTVDSKFGTVSTNFSFDQVRCSGQEHFLEDCTYESINDCGPNEGAGVVCQGESNNFPPGTN